MILFIHTADVKYIIVGLIRDENFIAKKRISSRYKQSEKLLASIDTLLKEQRIHLKSIKGIVVVNGPGPFTALRIGVVLANTFSFALKIPLASVSVQEYEDEKKFFTKISTQLQKKLFKPIEPRYGQDPNISKPKKK